MNPTDKTDRPDRPDGSDRPGSTLPKVGLRPVERVPLASMNPIDTRMDAREGRQRDPYISPQYTLSNRIRRQLWNTCWSLLYAPSPRTAHGWRAMLLRLFGAQLGENCHFYPLSRIWAPWNLECEDTVTVGDRAELYNPSHLYLASHVMISEGAYICGATHDYNDPEFPVVSCPMRIGRYAWIAARACVSPAVDVADGAILGLASVATHDLELWGIYAGAPAKKVKERVRIV